MSQPAVARLGFFVAKAAAAVAPSISNVHALAEEEGWQEECGAAAAAAAAAAASRAATV